MICCSYCIFRKFKVEPHVDVIHVIDRIYCCAYDSAVNTIYIGICLFTIENIGIKLCICSPKFKQFCHGVCRLKNKNKTFSSQDVDDINMSCI